MREELEKGKCRWKDQERERDNSVKCSKLGVMKNTSIYIFKALLHSVLINIHLIVSTQGAVANWLEQLLAEQNDPGLVPAILNFFS